MHLDSKKEIELDKVYVSCDMFSVLTCIIREDSNKFYVSCDMFVGLAFIIREI
jgi:hypothetical protein